MLAAVASPKLDTTANHSFDGKIGIWSLITKEPARCSGHNQSAGTIVTKAITSVTANVYRGFLIDNFLPDIQDNWPWYRHHTPIKIQQDNARPHVPPNDPAFVAYIQATGLYIRLLFQSSNRNDISLLDIGFFKSLQCLQHTRYPSNIDKQITVFQESFQQVQSNKLNNNFLTLQKVMELCIIREVKNDYKLPHINKTKLDRGGLLPVSIKCSEQLLNV